MAGFVDILGEKTARRRIAGCGPSPIAWIAAASLLAFCWSIGISPNSDVDDLLKLHEIRTFLEAGSVFDRNLPGVLQPEPLISHWSWITDLPYAAVAATAAPAFGAETGLSIASFAVPLLLLGPVIFLLYRIVAAAGFDQPGITLALVLIMASRPLFEFAPGRIDYHNLGILLLLALLALAMARSRLASFLGGAAAALIIAITPEFALFSLVAMGVHAAEFVIAAHRATGRLLAFGAGLSTTAILSFAATTSPEAYWLAACDRYSAPQLYVLVVAGAAFIAVSALARRRDAIWRALVLALAAAAGLAGLTALFPECLNGPFADLGDYVRENWLNRIGQEQSLLERRDFVLSSTMAMAAALFMGALAPAVAALAQRGRNRPLAIFALFSLLALVHAVFYFRYLRYLPLFSGLGLLLCLAALAPSLRKAGAALAGRATEMLPPPHQLALPGVAISAALFAFHLFSAPAEAHIPAAEIAGGCEDAAVPALDWPRGSRLLAPPTLGMRFLVAAPGEPAVIAIPFHSAARGIERAYRFLDPLTGDPRAVLDEARATHVSVCAWRGEASASLRRDYPLAAALMEGRPPAWLVACPGDKAGPIRIYSYRSGASGVACPVGD